MHKKYKAACNMIKGHNIEVHDISFHIYFLSKMTLVALFGRAFNFLFFSLNK